MEVEKDDERNAHPNIEDEIDAAPDAGPLRDMRRVIGHPGEIEAASGCDDGEPGHDRRTAALIAGVKHDAHQ